MDIFQSFADLAIFNLMESAFLFLYFFLGKNSIIWRRLKYIVAVPDGIRQRCPSRLSAKNRAQSRSRWFGHPFGTHARSAWAQLIPTCAPSFEHSFDPAAPKRVTSSHSNRSKPQPAHELFGKKKSKIILYSFTIKITAPSLTSYTPTTAQSISAWNYPYPSSSSIYSGLDPSR